MKNVHQEMSFLEHLEVVRWHLVRICVAVLLGTVIAFLNKQILFQEIILGPTRIDFTTYFWLCKLGQHIGIEAFCIPDMPFILQSRHMSGQLSMHIGAACVAGLVIAFPYISWELWRFISPALQVRTRSWIRVTSLVVSGLFFMGICFGYYILVPVSVQFLANYQVDSSIVNHFDIISYVSTVLLLTLCSGLLFQLPVVVFFLTKSGLISADLLRRYKRLALIITLVLSAMITPPDPFSQLLVAVPILLLYFLSIFIAAWVAPSDS